MLYNILSFYTQLSYFSDIWRNNPFYMNFVNRTYSIICNFLYIFYKTAKLKCAFLPLCIITMLIAPSQAASYPLVTNYNRSDYGAGTQNWDINQDSFGRMLFANNTGLLIYDSHNWSMLQLSNYTTVRSIWIDDTSGRIYAGGSEEFGYFTNNPGNSVLEYVSLVETLPEGDRKFTEIWNIFGTGESVWFQGDFNIFRYDGHATVSIPYNHKITTSAFVNDRLFIASQEGGVCILNGNLYTPIDGNELLRGKRICSILPYTEGKILFVTDFDGIFAYDGTSVAAFKTDIDDFLKDNQVFCAATNGKELVFGTVNNGIVIKDIANGNNTYVNTRTGMQNNTVLSIGFDKMDNIWLGLDNGIDHVLYNSPISTLFGSNMYGAGYASMLKGGTLYLGTNQGLYRTGYPIRNSPIPVRLELLMKSQIWCIDTINSAIFIGSDRGLFMLDRHNAITQITGVPGTWSMVALKSRPGYALASTYEGFYLLRNTGGDHWEMRNRVAGYDEAGGRIIEDDFGRIWISHWMKGVYKLQLSNDMKRFDEVTLYNHTKGFPTERNNTLYEIDGNLEFSTEGGFYKYNSQTDSMIPDDMMNSLFGIHTSIRLYQSPYKDVWGVSAKYICAAFYNATGTYDIDTITYKPLLDKLIVGFENFNFTSPRKLIASNEDGFFEIDIDRDHKVNWKSKLFVNKVYATGLPGDSLIYSTNSNMAGGTFAFPYELNSLRFEFIYPEYRQHGAVEYSYYLENYDLGWSRYSQATSKEYTKLREGKYTLHLRSFNRYDDSREECTFTFSILPPWYRSIWAYLLYALLAATAVWQTVRIIRQKARKAAIVVAKRKSAELAEYKRKAEEEQLRKENEIAHLKSEQLEHDIKHKSQELSSATMNVMRKNEILIDIANQITKLQESDNKTTFTADTIKRLNKIQKLIQENISHDDDWQKFAHNFDVVYEDYLKRLVAKFPQLSINDQRLCAYLKMGLSSKEIAPLLNISYRSAEMARYRLRKKMQLSREVNLAEYLQHL